MEIQTYPSPGCRGSETSAGAIGVWCNTRIRITIYISNSRYAYPLPKLEDTFSALSGSKWFSVLDLKSGYYQIEMDETEKVKTPFVCPLGFYEFNRMPQGITSAQRTFQRLMERCMGKLHVKDMLVFIDDLIVFAPILEEHEERLMNVLNRLKEFGLKLSLDKCMFFQTSVKYLGHVVSQNAIETDPDKIKTLTSWPVPQNLRVEILPLLHWLLQESRSRILSYCETTE